MGFTWWDVFEVAAPIVATAIGGPVAGMAVGGAVSGGRAKARGESTKSALLKTALGVGAGAAGAGVTGATSKAATKAGAKAAEQAVVKGATQMAATRAPLAALPVGQGLGMGAAAAASPVQASVTKEALAKFSETAAKGAATQTRWDKLAALGAKGLGKNEAKTGATLKMGTGVGKGAGVVQQASTPPPMTDFRPLHQRKYEEQQVRFSQLPGLDPYYQYGTGGSVGSRFSTATVRSGGYY